MAMEKGTLIGWLSPERIKRMTDTELFALAEHLEILDDAYDPDAPVPDRLSQWLGKGLPIIQPSE